MQFACGTKATGTATGNISIDVGFTPKFICYVCTGAPDGAAGAVNAVLGIGWQSGTTGSGDGSGDIQAVSVAAEDGAPTTDTYRRWSASRAIVVTNGTTGAIILQGAATTLASTVTFNIAVAPATSLDLKWWAIGGADVTASHGKLDVPGSVGTSPSITGLSHAPNLLLAISISQNTIADTLSTILGITVGIAVKAPDNTIKQVVFCLVSADAAAATNSFRYANTARWFHSMGVDGSAGANAHVSAFNSDGATVTWDQASAAPGNDIFYHALTVPYADLALEAIANTGSQQSWPGSTQLAFIPQGAVVVGHGTTESTLDTAQDTAELNVGAVDGVNQWSTWIQDLDAQDPTDANSLQQSTKTYDRRNSGSLTADGALTYQSFASGRVNFTKAAPAAAAFLAVLLLGTNEFIAGELGPVDMIGPIRDLLTLGFARRVGFGHVPTF